MILIVDDELDRIDPIIYSLKLYGYEIITANSGHSSLSAISKHKDKIKIIIVDLKIPYGKVSLHDEYPGITLISEIRKDLEKVPILILTNVPLNDRVESIFSILNIRGHLYKPEITLDKIIDIVEEALS